MCGAIWVAHPQIASDAKKCFRQRCENPFAWSEITGKCQKSLRAKFQRNLSLTWAKNMAKFWRTILQGFCLWISRKSGRKKFHKKIPHIPQGRKHSSFTARFCQWGGPILSVRIGSGGSRQGRGNRPPMDDRNPMWNFGIDCLEASRSNGETRSQLTSHCIQEKNLYGNSAATPHCRYGHRLLRPFLLTRFRDSCFLLPNIIQKCKRNYGTKKKTATGRTNAAPPKAKSNDDKDDKNKTLEKVWYRTGSLRIVLSSSRMLPREMLRIFPEFLEDFSCFVSWSMATAKSSPNKSRHFSMPNP